MEFSLKEYSEINNAKNIFLGIVNNQSSNVINAVNTFAKMSLEIFNKMESNTDYWEFFSNAKIDKLEFEIQKYYDTYNNFIIEYRKAINFVPELPINCWISTRGL